jgi:hypothetical protein
MGHMPMSRSVNMVTVDAGAVFEILSGVPERYPGWSSRAIVDDLWLYAEPSGPAHRRVEVPAQACTEPGASRLACRHHDVGAVALTDREGRLRCLPAPRTR